MIVVTNRIPVTTGHEIDFEDCFRNRVYLGDPDAEGYYEVKTWWRSMDDFVAWTRSEAFAEADANRPHQL